MKRVKRYLVCIFSFIVISVFSNLFGQKLEKKGNYWIGTIHKSFMVKGDGNLIMKDVNGDVFVKTWEKEEIDIHEIKKMDIFTENEAKAAMEASEGGYIQDGNSIKIGGSAFDRQWIRSKFNITLPIKFNCNISTKGGDLSITDLEGIVHASSGGGDISLSSIDGPVECKTGGGDIDITDTSNEVDAKTGGGDVVVTKSIGAVSVSTGGGDVEIRSTKNSVSVKTGGGDVEIYGTEDDTHVTTGGGDILIQNAGGNVTALTGGGEIDIMNIDGQLSITTGGGDIQGKSVSGSVTLTTGGGDVEVLDVKGAADITTGGGDVIAEITLIDYTLDHHVNIKTGGGNIQLIIPDDIPATIHATVKYHQKGWEKYEITSDFPLTITKDDKETRYQIIEAKGNINGGGDLIQLKSGGGDIQIQKAQK